MCVRRECHRHGVPCCPLSPQSGGSHHSHSRRAPSLQERAWRELLKRSFHLLDLRSPIFLMSSAPILYTYSKSRAISRIYIGSENVNWIEVGLSSSNSETYTWDYLEYKSETPPYKRTKPAMDTTKTFLFLLLGIGNLPMRCY
jgi:hypothetical protein